MLVKYEVLIALLLMRFLHKQLCGKDLCIVSNELRMIHYRQER